MRNLKRSQLNKSFDLIEVPINYKIKSFKIFKNSLNLKKQIKELNPDIIHISGLQLYGFYACLISKISVDAKILLTVRGSSTESLNINKFKKYILGKIIEPLSVQLSDAVYAVSENMIRKKNYILKNKKFIGSIPNPAPNIVEAKYYSIRNELNLSENDFLCIYTGRITFEKGLTYLIDAFRNLTNNDSMMKLILCGDGIDFDFYHQNNIDLLNDKKIFMLGKRENVIEILKDCDLFIFPTLHENLSNSLLEAAAVGIPIIATNVGGNTEIIINNYNGVLIRDRSQNDIKEKVIYLKSNAHIRKNLSQNMKKTINEHFNLDKISRKISNIYRSLI